MSKNDYTRGVENATQQNTERYDYVYESEYNRWRLGLLEVPVDGNIRPIVSNPIADISIYEDAAFTFQFADNVFTDANPDDIITYTATRSTGQSLPSWLSFNANTRTFSGTPRNDDVGILTIKIVATDSNLASVTNKFNLTVINTNDIPEAPDAPINQSMEEDSTISFIISDATFKDPDIGDFIVTYEMVLIDGTPLPSWMTFDSTTREFSASPLNEHVGTHGIGIIGYDNYGASAVATLYLTVTNVNDAPTVVGSLTNQALTDADSLSYQFPSDTFADADLIHGDVLTYSASGLPSGITLDSNSRTFSGTAGIGSYNVTVTATDTAGETASLSFNIEVEKSSVVATSGPTIGGLQNITGNIYASSMTGTPGTDSVLGDLGGGTAVNTGGTLEIPSNFWIWSDNPSQPALIIDVLNMTLANNGYIIGRGGNGGSRSSAGGAGGTAIDVIANGVTILNNAGAYIAGGGGGGGGALDSTDSDGVGGGGGAGGGIAGTSYGGAGSTPGSIGESAGDGARKSNSPTSIAGIGGPHGGFGGTLSSQDGGANDWTTAISGGRNPSSSDTGSAPSGGDVSGGYGGFWGQAGGSGIGRNSKPGGSAGAAITGSHTLTNSGTIYGPT